MKRYVISYAVTFTFDLVVEGRERAAAIREAAQRQTAMSREEILAEGGELGVEMVNVEVQEVLRATVGETERDLFPIGRALWEGDVGSSDVAGAWERLFGEPFDKSKAIEKEDLGDAIGYLMPGGFVVFDETYDTNHGIYAPPRKAPQGGSVGLEDRGTGRSDRHAHRLAGGLRQDRRRAQRVPTPAGGWGRAHS